ncbi:MAG: nucleoside triphosphate pyrophosphohydrolase [Alphaproteobacteria bacterium]
MLGYRFKVGKLIRDKLPSIMRDQGLRIFEHSMDDEAFEAALRAKLIEEAAEAQSAQTRTDLAHELADLQEVILALASFHGLSAQDVEAVRLKKRRARGGFDGRIFNAAVEADLGLPAANYYLSRPEQYPQDT